jgi:ketosteroid isomerase-like protein
MGSTSSCTTSSRLHKAYDRGVDTRDAARRWAKEWCRGWIDHDCERIAALYAPDALFLSAPFRDPQQPREYALQAFAEEDAADPCFGEPLVDADRAAVEWRARIRQDGKDFTLAGVSLLRFRDDGLCVEQRDAWEMKEGVLPRNDV